jgi:hypothetical protein
MRDKAVKQEHNIALAFGKAAHKHDLAVADKTKTAHELSVCLVLLGAIRSWSCTSRPPKPNVRYVL